MNNFPPFAPYPQTARCGRVLRRPDRTNFVFVSGEMQPIIASPDDRRYMVDMPITEPDANTGDRIVATVCAIGIVVLLVLLIVEKVAT
ncbi:MAG: hypothetical protein M0P19_08855 [Nevskia sp.]|nr:hypothetical protein [Nevskia sp.]